jgi:protein-tyrosine kinase
MADDRSTKGDDGASLLERAARKLEFSRSAEAPVVQRTVLRPNADPVVENGSSSKASKQSRRGEIDLFALREAGFIVPDSPATITAEEFRIVKRTLLLNAFERGDGAIRNGNLILVSSAQPNEGKTFCAINLALSIASERDLTVLLVDADFAKPEVLSTLGLEGGKGLIDVIADPSIDLSDCLIRTNIENLSVLPAGRQHHLTTELLASERMGAMIEEIAQRYPDRVIIFDSPPALASSAASVLALHVGQALFVVEAESTRDAQLREGLSMISACKNMHLLLNKTRYLGTSKRFGSYYGYGYGYGYGS